MTEPMELHLALSTAARYLQENQGADAAELLLPHCAEHSDNPDLAINLGGAYILQRKWKKAVDVLEPASRQHPDNAMIWMNLAASYLGSLEFSGPEQQKKAINAYEQALRINPYTPNVHYDLGLIYKDRHEYEKAADYFRQAIKVNPRDKDARLWITRMEGALAEKEAILNPSGSSLGSSSPSGSSPSGSSLGSSSPSTPTANNLIVNNGEDDSA